MYILAFMNFVITLWNWYIQKQHQFFTHLSSNFLILSLPIELYNGRQCWQVLQIVTRTNFNWTMSKRFHQRGRAWWRWDLVRRSSKWKRNEFSLDSLLIDFSQWNLCKSETPCKKFCSSYSRPPFLDSKKEKLSLPCISNYVPRTIIFFCSDALFIENLLFKIFRLIELSTVIIELSHL